MTRAVIFDLWRTLVPLESTHKVRAMNDLAIALDCDTEDFRRVWAETRIRRETRTLDAYLSELSISLGVNWSAESLAAAKDARLTAHYAAFANVREGTRELLEQLSKSGIALGLVSNCSSDVRQMLSDSGIESFFDTIILSAEVGVVKPNAEIFRLALNGLNVDTAYYVGDGDDGELAGAKAAGLTDILLDLGEGRSATMRVGTLNEVAQIVIGAPQ